MSTMKEIRFDTTFNSYRTLTPTPIGEGGSAKVYKVADEDGEVYALKCLDSKAPTQKRKRFKNEIHFCMRNAHKNIVRVLDYGVATIKDEKCPFYVMPYYPSSLRDLLSNGIPRDKVLRYFSQILDGVEAAHLQGIWHRDLKPENILHDPNSDLLMVADFGIAHFAEELLQTSVETKPRDRLANFQYAAPEQRLVGQKVDHRADIFALGLILNEMFTGQVPHGTGYLTIGQVAPEHAYLDGIVEIMLRQVPEERFASIDMLKQQLIARRNEFISRQRLSELKKTVIPRSEIDDPLISDPVRLVDVDIQKGQLIFILSQPVNGKWVQAFKNMGNYSYMSGREPRTFEFHENKARIPAPTQGHSAQQLVEYFKGYVKKANDDYKAKVENEQHRREEEERRRLQAEVEEEEKRQRLLKSIKI